jgi:hypothetical protein
MPEVDGRMRELVDQVQTAVAHAVVTCLASAGTTNPLGRSGTGRSKDPVLAMPARDDRTGDYRVLGVGLTALSDGSGLRLCGGIRMEWRFGPRCAPQLGWLSESGLGLFVPIGDRAVQVDEVQTVVNGQPTP